jgi:hypothetical protein
MEASEAKTECKGYGEETGDSALQLRSACARLTRAVERRPLAEACRQVARPMFGFVPRKAEGVRGEVAGGPGGLPMYGVQYCLH